METRRLEYFLALAKERSFRRAAAGLFISQPALSQQIQRLEQEVGAILIDRSVAPFELTQAGRVLLENSTRIIDELRQIEGLAERARKGVLGRLRVGIAPSLMYSPVPDLLRRFRIAHPEVQVNLAREHTKTILDLVDQQRLDLGLTFSQRGREGMRWQTIYEDRFVVVLPEGHRLARNDEVTVAELAQDPFLMLTRSGVPDLHDAIIAACARAGFSPATHDTEFQAEGAGYVDQIGLVAAGYGVAIIPAAVATLGIRGAIYRPLKDDGLTMPTSACWSAANQNPAIGPIVQWFAAAFRAGAEHGAVTTSAK